MNEVTLIGRSGAKGELKYTQNGMAILNLSIATSEKQKDNTYKTSWHRVVVFAKTAEAFAPRIDKGTEVFVQGKINYNEWVNKDNQKVKSTDILAYMIKIIESAPRQEDFNQQSAPAPQQQPQHQAPLDDMDIPF